MSSPKYKDRFSLESAFPNSSLAKIGDDIIDFTPIGDVRDIYEGLSNQDYQRAVLGGIGLATSALGGGILLKAFKNQRKFNKIVKAIKNFDNNVVITNGNRVPMQMLRRDAMNVLRNQMNDELKPSLKLVPGALAGKSIDWINDGISVVDRHSN